MPKKRLPMVVVSWSDAAAARGWHSDDVDCGLLPVMSVGILVVKAKDHITLSQSYAENKDRGGLLSIPKAYIHSMKRVGHIEIP